MLDFTPDLRRAPALSGDPRQSAVLRLDSPTLPRTLRDSREFKDVTAQPVMAVLRLIRVLLKHWTELSRIGFQRRSTLLAGPLDFRRVFHPQVFVKLGHHHTPRQGSRVGKSHYTTTLSDSHADL